MSKSEVLASERGNQMVTPTEDYYPDHDGGKFAPILATTVATWRARAFLENLADRQSPRARLMSLPMIECSHSPRRNRDADSRYTESYGPALGIGGGRQYSRSKRSPRAARAEI